MKMKNILALALVLAMALSLVACGGGEDTTSSTESTAPTESTSANTAYSVKLVDALGNPYTENIVVKFMQGGQQVAMQNVNAEGVASKELTPGDYDIELLFTDGAAYHYDTENLKVSEAKPDLVIEMAGLVDGECEYLFVDGEEHEAPYIVTGCIYVELTAGARNYFVFTPVQSGIYEITVHHAESTVGYYGSPFFVLAENSGTVTGEHSVSVEVKDSSIGSGDGGTVQLVIGVDAGVNTENCVLSIARIGEYVLPPEEQPWTVYEPTFAPGKYTLPEGVELKDFDLTASHTLVFNETDGFYHLNSADGPIVLVRLHSALTYGGSLGDILANANVGTYFYDETGAFQYKELYNDCLLQYLGTLNKGMGTYSYSDGMMDENYGVYPLTKDLEYIIKTYGDRCGWWEMGHANYLFAALPNLNVEFAWLFMCCYAE